MSMTRQDAARAAWHEAHPHLTPRAYLAAHEDDHEWRADTAWGIIDAWRRHLAAPDAPAYQAPADTGLIRDWMAAFGSGDATDAECVTAMQQLLHATTPAQGIWWNFAQWAASEAWPRVKAWWLDYGSRTDYQCWLRDNEGGDA